MAIERTTSTGVVLRLVESIEDTARNTRKDRKVFASVIEAVRELRCSERTVRKMVTDGEIAVGYDVGELLREAMWRWDLD